MWIIVLLGLVFPRFAAVALYFMTDWFDGIFQAWLWPLIGFLFAPYTMLWYTVVINWYGGTWDTMPLIVLAVAILADLGISQKWLRS